MQDPARPGASRLLPALACVGALVAAAASTWNLAEARRIGAEIAGTKAELETLSRTVRLIRIEGSSEGRGIGAILEQIRFWAPQLATSSTPHPAAIKIEENLWEAVDVIEALGASAFGPILAALESPEAQGDETRKWMLRAALRADPAKAKALVASVVRGTRLAPSPRLRFLAADELLGLDQEFAGDVLSQVLQIESAQGVTRTAPPGLAPEYERVIGTNAFPDFFNFIERFVRSKHEDVPAVLQMILGRSEHDRMTYQECVRWLGELRVRDALPRIKDLYATPPRGEFNPLFLNVCLQAIADIDGPGACAFFREELRRVDVPVVSTKLQDLLKQHCGAN
ncbi:MAG: hypothetical protein O2865_17000 [Planctomycetota bacterium]|nr:hypothetical protein [Planctomycetota bacterium]MDA0932370.1 hypothetical protein [Planctomycetota bacterium]